MRYQQVYDRSLFTNVSPNLIYVTTLQFFTDPTQTKPIASWTVPSMQINLSTTAKGPGDLSPVFSENVGPDDVVVFGPASQNFPGSLTYHQFIQFSRPFTYNPSWGSLLVDVRIFNGSGPPDPLNINPLLQAYNSPTDQVSRVWATNVAATTASGTDTIGLFTGIQFSPIPSLRVFTFTNAGTNYIEVDWPTEPMTFHLQQSSQLGKNAMWGLPTNVGGVFVSNQVNQRYYFPASSPGAGAYYRLIWPGQ
jgi:hypothetical protein